MPQLRAIRLPRRPILIPRTDNLHWWERNGIFNAGVAEYQDQILLVYRAYDDYRISRLGLATSKDGIDFKLYDYPIVDTNPSDEFERIGIEDPRVTQIGDTYYIVHTSASYKRVGEQSDVSKEDYMPWRVRVGMHSTKDFKSFVHHGVILPDIRAKNASLLPQKINGAFALYYREFTDAGEILKVAFTHDFVSWFGTKTILWPENKNWSERKYGLGSQPISISQGFLVVSHGVNSNSEYRLGLMLFDKNDPSRLIWSTDQSILEPEMPYEKEGFIPNVVYTCGALVKNNELWIYYGGADRVMGRAILSMKDITEAIKHPETNVIQE
ncbi:MAG: hypothetical protein A3E36_04230 [Candidatus Andersenbacteria bacterium RIFCSPHIGHO2_12_FULL_45_11b]|uniref:Glycosidase n=1 Tax=Candidatus Andersenbacteria bacterium RIFCSPHIGHO2_12_FULL_45_11b TaxID=1797282 RepID=A0A1G1XD12_9BACT|nr:MAG: hypothetical protein A3E36_04230 [Candidatus Andersenbacteria bacterium RIFCSPHIGHO2_12_FULL_45_11b]